MSDVAKKLLWTIGLWIPSAVVSVILRRVFQAWGVFDPFSEWLGGWLKMHVSPSQVEWTIAAVITSVAYAGLLWIVWRYHRPTQIIYTRLGGSIGIDVGKAAATEIPELAISLLTLLHPKGENKGLRTARVNIENISSSTIKNCCVREDAFTNKFGNQSKLRRYFRLSEETYADMSVHSYKKAFDLRQEDIEIIDIAQLDETKDDSAVIMLYATEPTAPTLNAIARECFPHRLTISVTADNLPVAEKRTYDLKIIDTGILEMSPVIEKAS